MKSTTSTLLAAALLLGVTTTASHAQTAPSRKAFGTGEFPEFLKTYDLNNDGKLSVEERQAFETATRDAKPPRPGAKNPWDTDGDGKLSDAEKQAARDAIAAKITAQRTARFNELDTNTDGFLDNAELLLIPRITQDQVTAMIGHLDKDADGKISLAEFTAALAPVEPPVPPFPLPQPLPPGPCVAHFLLRAFDTDNNHMLSPAELAAMVAALDTNTDGRISADEWKAYVLAHLDLLPPPPAPPAP